jgi:hypothetical protein
MSTLAIWLFIAVVLLLVGAVAFVVLAARTTVRKGRRLSRELATLSEEIHHSIGSQQRTELDR